MSTTLNYLIPTLRYRLGDPTGARYTDAWLEVALVEAVKALGRYWNFKYLISSTNEVSRNPSAPNFVLDEATYGVIQYTDEYIITLMATIITQEGSLENSAWDAVSWKDNEISFSNLEQFRSKDSGVKRLIDELNLLILPPTKKLARTQKGSLPGYSPSGASGYEKTGI